MVRAQQCQRLCWAWCCWLLLCIVCCHGGCGLGFAVGLAPIVCAHQTLGRGSLFTMSRCCQKRACSGSVQVGSSYDSSLHKLHRPLLSTPAAGQGLVTNTRISSTLVSSRALANAYRSATARRAAEFRRLMAAVRTSCVSRAGQSARLCATAVKGSAASLDADALRLAMGPNSFSGRAYTYLSPPKDQKGCATCVA
jgi:hypothetical protein